MKTFIPYVLLFLMPAACDYLGGSSSWQAVLPAWPSHWQATFPDAPARLVTAAADGSVSSSVVSSTALSFPVRLEKQRNSLVLLYLRTDGGKEKLRPFGAVFPACADFDRRTLALSVTGGFVAERLLRLTEQGFDTGSFNTERLLSEIRERDGDPWKLDALLLETRLAERNFSVYAIKNLPVRSVSLQVGEGEWFGPSPRSPLWIVAGENPLNIPELTFGYHTLFRKGTQERVYLHVTEEEVIIFQPDFL